MIQQQGVGREVSGKLLSSHPHHSNVERDEAGDLIRRLGNRAVKALGTVLPPPLAQGNWESDGSRCYMNKDIQARQLYRTYLHYQNV